LGRRHISKWLADRLRVTVKAPKDWHIRRTNQAISVPVPGFPSLNSGEIEKCDPSATGTLSTGFSFDLDT